MGKSNKEYNPKKDHRSYVSVKGTHKKMNPHRKGKSKMPMMRRTY